MRQTVRSNLGPSAMEGRVPKKIDRSAQIGDGGIALIHRRVNERGYAWREKGKDAGVDGEIEFRAPGTGEVASGTSALNGLRNHAAHPAFPATLRRAGK